MAKKDKTKKKSKAELTGAAIESQSIEMAHKIWLAGVGAYGKAYDVATERAGKMTYSTTEVFDDLVERGEEIEAEMKARVASNKAFSKIGAQLLTAGKQISKLRSNMRDRAEEVTDTVSKFQDEQRERLEARMERMREALGLTALAGKSKKAAKLHSQLDSLEEQVASLRSEAEGVDEKVKARVERLSAEIAKVASAKPKKAKKPKKGKKVEPTAPEAKESASTDARGRLDGPMGEADDLKLIKGVGVVLERKLNEAGVYHFWQVAALNNAQVEELETEMRFPGRITRDAWVSQAADFAKAN